MIEVQKFDEDVFEKMRVELERCLEHGGINYLTAAYYLTIKHEFE